MRKMEELNSQDSENKKAVDRKTLAFSAIALVLVGLAFTLFYLRVAGSRVYDEDAEISAPEITLASQKQGILEEIYVKEGDIVPRDFAVARVGEELVKAKEQGLVVSAASETGKIASPSVPVVTMINPNELRVVVRVEENKGLSRIKVGQQVIFTVDAFGSKEFYGIVDEIGVSSRESGLSFDISSQRPTKEFNVKVRYNTGAYPELKNGMSAKVWIYK